jgi:hypothetical protein
VSDVNDALFAAPWVQLFEEDSADGEVYRPDAGDIPLSRRPRRRLSFSPDGSARVALPGPDDRLREQRATWQQDGDVIVLRTTSDSGGAEQVLRVSRQSPNRLIVRTP